MKKAVTKLINLYGGPGAGKTTTALRLTEHLKRIGVHAVYVPEAATDLVYEGKLPGANQFDILMEQLRRQLRLEGQCDYIVTDSPIFMQLTYSPEETKAAILRASGAYAKHEQINFFIMNIRTTHETRGRLHGAEEANKKDIEILALLHDSGIPFTKVQKDTALDDILDHMALKVTTR